MMRLTRPTRFAMLSIYFGIPGALIRIGSIVALQVWHSELARPLILYDRFSYWLAEEGLTWFFDRRGIGPSSEQVLVFNVFLVLGLAVQCALLGAVVQAIVSALRRHRVRRA
jgi:hypothetical protein